MRVDLNSGHRSIFSFLEGGERSEGCNAASWKLDHFGGRNRSYHARGSPSPHRWRGEGRGRKGAEGQSISQGGLEISRRVERRDLSGSEKGRRKEGRPRVNKSRFVDSGSPSYW